MNNPKEKILQKVEAFVVDAMGVNDPAHDGDHIKRVVTLTRKLLTFYPQANAFRTELLAWLHDMQDDKLAAQAETASLADCLHTIGAEKEDIDFALSAIPYISYRKYPKLPEGTPIEICIVPVGCHGSHRHCPYLCLRRCKRQTPWRKPCPF